MGWQRPHWLLAFLFRCQGAARGTRRPDRVDSASKRTLAPVPASLPVSRGWRSGFVPVVRVNRLRRSRKTVLRADVGDYMVVTPPATREAPFSPDFCRSSRPPHTDDAAWASETRAIRGFQPSEAAIRAQRRLPTCTSTPSRSAGVNVASVSATTSPSTRTAPCPIIRTASLLDGTRPA